MLVLRPTCIFDGLCNVFFPYSGITKNKAVCIIIVFFAVVINPVQQTKNDPKRKGKIRQNSLDIIHIIQQTNYNTIQVRFCKWYDLLLWCSYVQTHNLLYKIVSIVFSSEYTDFSYNIQLYFICVIVLCVTMCSYASTRAEPVGYCVTISIMCLCVVHRLVQFWTLHSMSWWWLSDLTRTLSMPNKNCYMNFNSMHCSNLIFFFFFFFLKDHDHGKFISHTWEIHKRCSTHTLSISIHSIAHSHTSFIILLHTHHSINF